MELDHLNIYWNNSGKYEALADAVTRLMPPEVEVTTPALKTLRKAITCYYDLYDTGLQNRADDFLEVFGFSGPKLGESLSREYILRVEKVVNLLLIEAATEIIAGLKN